MPHPVTCPLTLSPWERDKKYPALSLVYFTLSLFLRLEGRGVQVQYFISRTLLRMAHPAIPHQQFSHIRHVTGNLTQSTVPEQVDKGRGMSMNQ